MLFLLSLRLRPTVRVEGAACTFWCTGNTRIPGGSGLDSAAGRRIVGGRFGWLRLARLIVGLEINTNVGGEPLEQRAGVARLFDLLFLLVE